MIFVYTFLSNYIMFISYKITTKPENRLSVIIYVAELLYLCILFSKADTDFALFLAAQYSSAPFS